jgi:hypothetical protein
VDGTIRRIVSDNDKDEVVDKQPLGNILGDDTEDVDAVPDLVNVPIVAGNQPPPHPPAAVGPLMTQEGTAQLPSRRPLSRCNSAPWQR